MVKINKIKLISNKPKNYCTECQEDITSVCKWCYADAIETGRNKEKDIKADLLAGHYKKGKEEEQKRIMQEELDWWNKVDIKLNDIDCECCSSNASKIVNRMNYLKQQIQSQKNPITTTEGVKIGGKSRITPKVMPEKVLHQSSDTLWGKDKKQ